MNNTIGDKIDVIIVFNSKNKKPYPYKFRWQNRDYLIKKLNYHYKKKENGETTHLFYVNDGKGDFCLKFNTETLSWILINSCYV